MALNRCILVLSLLFSGVFAFATPTDPLRLMAVQDGGRVKPFDSFANEMLFLVHGKQSFEGKPAHEIIFTWLLQPGAWQTKKLIEIKNAELKRALRFDVDQRYFSTEEVLANQRLSLVMQELMAKRETQEKLDPYFQSVQKLESQLGAFTGIAQGMLLRPLPPKDGSDTWISIDKFDEEEQKAFEAITYAFLNGLRSYNEKEVSEEEAHKQMEAAVASFTEFARSRSPEVFPSDFLLKAEIHYTSFSPYNWAGLIYLLSAIAMLIAWITGKSWAVRTAWILAILGLALHSYGFGLRSYLTGRPPVSNMYETVVWVSWGAIFFAMILEAIYKFRITLIAGALVGTLCLIVAQSAPTVLDPTLQPLEPVLRSSFWLIVHVLVITISYSAFFLALGLGNVGLYYVLRGQDNGNPKLRKVSMAIYRCLQIGVVLLTAGIILGGIWADYSWGRFWGWDPKETWALIALLGYLALLHARAQGLVRDIGMCVWAILTFSLVVMAWYGVNFVLGAGLHSYGFGAGGVEYVTGFVVLHALYVIFVLLVRRGRNSTPSSTASTT